MDFFPALGLAVLGIFATVMLTRILAGIIAFGIIDCCMRSQIQLKVVARLVDIPVDRFRSEFLHDVEEPEREELSSWWGERTFQKLSYRHDEITLARVIRRDPSTLFTLPYRQLCAQIANAVANELYEPERTNKSPARSCPATMLLLIADLTNERDLFARERLFARLVRVPVGVAKSRALGLVDTIQIALADAVQRRARQVATIVILIVFAGILIPSINTLNLLAGNGSLLLRSAGGILALAVAFVVIATLSVATGIVATLIFRWIDGFASTR